MKMYYEALLDVFEEIEQEMSQKETETTPYCIHHMKEAVWEILGLNIEQMRVSSSKPSFIPLLSISY